MRRFTESDTLWYKTPAMRFEDAVPLGNGRIGAMVYCGTDVAVVGLNNDEMWSGLPGDGLNGKNKETFFEARRLALGGHFREAQDLIERDFAAADTASYLPVGEMRINFGDGGVPEDYRRALSMKDSVAEAEYIRDGVRFSQEYFLSNPDKCLFCRIKTDSPVSFTVSLGSPYEHSYPASENSMIHMRGNAPARSVIQTDRSSFDIGVHGDKGMFFSVRVCIKTDGKCAAGKDGALSVSGSCCTEIRLVCETSFNGIYKDPVKEGKDDSAITAETLRDACSVKYDEALERHIRDHRSYYDRVTLSVGEDGRADVPTDRRLEEFAGGEGCADNGLYALLFNFGRYLTISASREGTLAMNLQGIWNSLVNPPWSSNFTVNINTEMNYYSTLTVNLAELTEPLDRLITDISDKGKKTAREMYGAGGFVCHHNTDIWGHTATTWGNARWSFWPMAGGWLCHHLYDKYEYTLDKGYLRDTAFPLMRSAAEFYLDMLVECDGYLIMAPSTSPENDYVIGDTTCAVAKTTTMTMAIIRELFSNCLSAESELGISDPVCDRIREVIGRLMPLRIADDGRIEEWYTGGAEIREREPGHRHMSHLYSLYPAREITDKTPEYREAARKTLEGRGDAGPGWSIGWKACLRARLGDGDRALKLLNMQLAPAVKPSGVTKDGTLPNLFSSYPPFQIDSNFGYMSAVCEMLLQSDGDKVVPLPALPSAWKDGYVRGLRARGGKVVDIAWKDHKITEFSVRDI